MLHISIKTALKLFTPQRCGGLSSSEMLLFIKTYDLKKQIFN